MSDSDLTDRSLGGVRGTDAELDLEARLIGPRRDSAGRTRVQTTTPARSIAEPKPEAAEPEPPATSAEGPPD